MGTHTESLLFEGRYCLIKDMSRLIYTQVSKTKKKKYFRLTGSNQLYS